LPLTGLGWHGQETITAFRHGSAGSGKDVAVQTYPRVDRCDGHGGAPFAQYSARV